MGSEMCIRDRYRNGRYYLGVGGGITADSDPGAEYEETRDKAKAILSALQ